MIVINILGYISLAIILIIIIGICWQELKDKKEAKKQEKELRLELIESAISRLEQKYYQLHDKFITLQNKNS